MTDRHESRVLDTGAYIDLGLLVSAAFTRTPELTAITLAEASAQGLPLYTRNAKDS